MKVYEKLRMYRYYTGAKQADVAKAAGITIKKLSAIELGKQKLTVDTFEKICIYAFKVEPSIFFATQFLLNKN